MIASRTGLAVLAAIAVALAGVVAWDAWSLGKVRGDGALFPDFESTRIAELRWSGGPRPVALVSGPRGNPGGPESPVGWMVCLDEACAQHLKADAARVDELVAAMRGGRWHRQAPAGTAGAIERTLDMRDRDSKTTSVGLGRSLDGLDQRWLVIEREALLVDGWIARALFPEPLALASRFPLARAHMAETIELPGNVRVEGHPRRRGKLWVDPVRVEALERALAALELQALPNRAISARSLVRLDGGASAVGPAVETDACPKGMLALWADSGSGCIAPAQWEAVVRSADQLARADAEVADPQLVPIAPQASESLDCAGVRDKAQRCGASIELTDHHELSLRGRPQLDGQDADPDRVAELMHALRAKGEIVSPPVDAPRATLEIANRDEICHLEVHGDGVVVRREDAIALKPDPAVFAILARGGEAYRDPTRWVEEPTTITAISVDGTTFHRGAVLGEWIGASDPALVEALVIATATVRARSSSAPVAVHHRVAVTIAPPAGSPLTHHLELGDITSTGCPGRADGQPVQLPLALCTAVLAVAR
jgi:hypothetical protein